MCSRSQCDGFVGSLGSRPGSGCAEILLGRASVGSLTWSFKVVCRLSDGLPRHGWTPAETPISLSFALCSAANLMMNADVSIRLKAELFLTAVSLVDSRLFVFLCFWRQLEHSNVLSGRCGCSGDRSESVLSHKLLVWCFYLFLCDQILFSSSGSVFSYAPHTSEFNQFHWLLHVSCFCLPLRREQPIFSTRAHVFQIDPSTKKNWVPTSKHAVTVSYFFDSTRNVYRIISLDGSKVCVRLYTICHSVSLKEFKIVNSICKQTGSGVMRDDKIC